MNTFVGSTCCQELIQQGLRGGGRRQKVAWAILNHVPLYRELEPSTTPVSLASMTLGCTPQCISFHLSVARAAGGAADRASQEMRNLVHTWCQAPRCQIDPNDIPLCRGVSSHRPLVRLCTYLEPATALQLSPLHTNTDESVWAWPYICRTFIA